MLKSIITPLSSLKWVVSERLCSENNTNKHYSILHTLHCILLNIKNQYTLCIVINISNSSLLHYCHMTSSFISEIKIVILNPVSVGIVLNFWQSKEMRCKKNQVKCIAFWDTHALCSIVIWVSAQTENTHTVHSIYTAYCRNSTSSVIVCYSEQRLSESVADGSLFSVQCCYEEKRVNERAEPLRWSARKRQKRFSWIDLKQMFPVRLLLPADWSCSSWLGHVIPVDRTHTSEARQETADEQMLPSRGNPAQVRDSTPPDPPGTSLSRTACSSAGRHNITTTLTFICHS